MDCRSEFDLEWELITQASRIAEICREFTEKERFTRLSNAIELCGSAAHSWEELYEVILGDGGIWEFGELYDNFPLEERLFWRLETYVLVCICRIACGSEQDYCPQDMELISENIPMFIEFLKTNFTAIEDCARCIEFFNNNLCY